jgi:glycosyltransferase involved in cell wall biosynthesis
MSVSVIIRTKNSEKQLERNVAFLAKQTLRPTEIIVVDSGSTDSTKYIAESTGCIFIDYCKSNTVFNYSKALNAGISIAKGDFILIISSHVWIPQPLMLQWMRDSVSLDKSIKAVSVARDKKPETFGNEMESFDWNEIDAERFKGAAMYNYCSMIKKCDWNVYAFNENIPTCEDQEWMLFWFKTEPNAKSIIINKPVVGYDNPNYNLKKDVQEFYISGKYIYPYHGSYAFLLQLYRIACQHFVQKRMQKAVYYFKLANALLLFKIITPEIQSDSYMSNAK